MTMALPRVIVLLNGFIVRDGAAIVDASSTVSLVLTGSTKIVVDTGSPLSRLKLVRALAGAGVDSGEVDLVVNTHLHVDHCGCNDVFENARFMAHSLESPPIHYVKLAGSITLSSGVEVVPTPGHCPGSITIFVSGDRKYALCGDAIPTKGNYEQHTPPFINTDRRLAVKSMDAILSWADVVVPGHDAPFTLMGKK